jgi:hypothetical protein
MFVYLLFIRRLAHTFFWIYSPHWYVIVSWGCRFAFFFLPVLLYNTKYPKTPSASAYQLSVCKTRNNGAKFEFLFNDDNACVYGAQNCYTKNKRDFIWTRQRRLLFIYKPVIYFKNGRVPFWIDCLTSGYLFSPFLTPLGGRQNFCPSEAALVDRPAKALALVLCSGALDF